MKPDVDTVEAALEAAGLTWRRRDEGWVVPPGKGRAREVRLTPTPDGVRVEAVLASWDDLGSDEREALALLLTRAAGELRLARCEMGETTARLAADVAAGEVEIQLGPALTDVARGVRLLHREASALLSPALAREYLAFFGGAGGKEDGPHP